MPTGIANKGLQRARTIQCTKDAKPMSAITKPFDLGLYTFKRQVMGPICPEDDQKMRDGQLVAVLHPTRRVDPNGIYCFGVDQESGDTKTLVRKNLRFIKVVTLKFTREPSMTAVEETHAQLNVALTYIKTQVEQLAL